MSKQEQKPRRRRKRKTSATVGGISQSAFANRTMADLQQATAASDARQTSAPDGDDDVDKTS